MRIVTTPSRPNLWTHYRVRLDFLTRVCGSVPADPELVVQWIKARQPDVKPPGALSIEEINEEVLASIERGEGEIDESYSLLVFQRHNGQIVQRAATIRAHIKDCARVISAQFLGRIKGERAFSTRVINGVYHDERQYWLPLLRPDGSPITGADGERDKPIHARGPQGQTINALKRYEFVDPPVVMDFRLKVLGRSISQTDLDHIFSYGGVHGYGGERSDGEGRYNYTLEALDDESPTGERAEIADGRSHRGKA
jgi:hypothetical protein